MMKLAKKITSITLYEKRTGKNVSWDKVHIEKDGVLNFDSYDLGELPQKLRGHEDYEYDLNVAAEWKDTVLLLLLKDRFKSVNEFSAWAEANNIPNTTHSWS